MNKVIIILLLFILSSSCAYNMYEKKDIDLALSRSEKPYIDNNKTIKKYNIENEFYTVKQILNDINIKTYGIRNWDKKYIRLKVVEHLDRMLLATPSDDIHIGVRFLKSIEEGIFTTEEVKAAICHEYSHILNDDWGYRIIAHNNTVLQNYKIKSIYDFYTVNLEGERTSSDLEKKDEDEILKEFYGKSKYENSYLFPINVEVNADILTINCLKRIGVSNGKNITIGLLRTLKHHFYANKKIDARISQLEAIK